MKRFKKCILLLLCLLCLLSSLVFVSSASSKSDISAASKSDISFTDENKDNVSNVEKVSYTNIVVDGNVSSSNRYYLAYKSFLLDPVKDFHDYNFFNNVYKRINIVFSNQFYLICRCSDFPISIQDLSSSPSDYILLVFDNYNSSSITGNKYRCYTIDHAYVFVFHSSGIIMPKLSTYNVKLIPYVNNSGAEVPLNYSCFSNISGFYDDVFIDAGFNGYNSVLNRYILVFIGCFVIFGVVRSVFGKSYRKNKIISFR